MIVTAVIPTYCTREPSQARCPKSDALCATRPAGAGRVVAGGRQYAVVELEPLAAPDPMFGQW